MRRQRPSRVVLGQLAGGLGHLLVICLIAVEVASAK
jgi:hypothetical protein